jgi:hypothetical protein
MKSKRKADIYFFLYDPKNIKEAETFMDEHKLSVAAYFSEDGLEDEDKEGSLELSFWYDGITLEVGEYLVIDEDDYACSMSKAELNDFVEQDL